MNLAPFMKDALDPAELFETDFAKAIRLGTRFIESIEDESG